MHTPRVPTLNVGRLSNGRYKFSFCTSAGTLFCEISAARSKEEADRRSDEQKKSEALERLRRLTQELDSILREIA